MKTKTKISLLEIMDINFIDCSTVILFYKYLGTDICTE